MDHATVTRAACTRGKERDGTLASERLGGGTRLWRVFQRVAAHCAPVRESSNAISGRDQRSEPQGRRRRGLNRLEHVTSEQVFRAVYAAEVTGCVLLFLGASKPFVRPLTIMRRIGGILGLHVKYSPSQPGGQSGCTA